MSASPLSPMLFGARAWALRQRVTLSPFGKPSSRSGAKERMKAARIDHAPLNSETQLPEPEAAQALDIASDHAMSMECRMKLDCYTHQGLIDEIMARMAQAPEGSVARALIHEPDASGSYVVWPNGTTLGFGELPALRSNLSRQAEGIHKGHLEDLSSEHLARILCELESPAVSAYEKPWAWLREPGQGMRSALAHERSLALE